MHYESSRYITCSGSQSHNLNTHKATCYTWITLEELRYVHMTYSESMELMTCYTRRPHITSRHNGTQFEYKQSHVPRALLYAWYFKPARGRQWLQGDIEKASCTIIHNSRSTLRIYIIIYIYIYKPQQQKYTLMSKLKKNVRHQQSL